EVVTNLLQRIGALEGIDGRGVEGRVQIVVAGPRVIDDVLLAREGDARRSQRQDRKADRAYAYTDRDVAHEASVVDDVELSAVGPAPITPHEEPVDVHHADPAPSTR